MVYLWSARGPAGKHGGLSCRGGRRGGVRRTGETVAGAGSLVLDETRGEVVLSAKIQLPEDKPCINEYGERVQAFAGCAKAAGGDAKMAGYFVFLVDVDTEAVYEALVKLGCKSRVHYSIQDGRKRAV